MANNLTYPITDGKILATKDIGGVHTPKTVLSDAAGADITTTNPMPVGLQKEDPLLNWAAGVKVTAGITSLALITPPAGCRYILVEPMGEVFIRADGTAAADAAGSMRYGTRDIIPVTAGVVVRVWAPASTVVYAVPYIDR